MKKFTADTFRKVLILTDDENTYDLETFIGGLNEIYDGIYEIEVDEIIEFLNDQYGIVSDQDITNMSFTEIDGLCDFINHTISETYADYEDEDYYETKNFA